MHEYRSLYRFNPEGEKMFEEVLTGKKADKELDETSSQFADPVEGTVSFRVRGFSTAKEMAASILGAFGDRGPIGFLPDSGIWCWLTFVLRDQLFRCRSDGSRILRERHRWYPSSPNNWLKAQRHLVRMPVLLLHSFDTDSDHLLCGRPSVHPDIREQLTSQQGMFNPTFQKLARTLYFDDDKGALKPGAGGQDGGSPRRLRQVRKQFDVTWELEDLEWEEILAKLPPEFDKFRSGL